MDTVQATVVTPVNVTPVGAQMNAEEDLRKTMQDTAQAVEEALNGFSDEVPTDDEATKAKDFLSSLLITSKEIHSNVISMIPLRSMVYRLRNWLRISLKKH